MSQNTDAIDLIERMVAQGYNRSQLAELGALIFLSFVDDSLVACQWEKREYSALPEEAEEVVSHIDSVSVEHQVDFLCALSTAFADLMKEECDDSRRTFAYTYTWERK